MKIRIGFVSNSSSSSFVASFNRYPSALAVARAMIEIRRDERVKEVRDGYNSEISLRYNERMIEVIDKLMESSENLSMPVKFTSCNYDTYIAPFNDGFHVSTCDNEPWNDIGAYHGDDFEDTDEDPQGVDEKFLDIDEVIMMEDGKVVYHCPKCGMMLHDGWCDRCVKVYEEFKGKKK